LADKRPTASTRFRTIQVCPKDLAFGANPVGYAPQIEALRLGLRGFGGFQIEDELAMAMSKGRPSPSNIAGLRADTIAFRRSQPISSVAKSTSSITHARSLCREAADDYPTGKPVRIGFLGPSLSNPFPSTLYQAFLAQLQGSMKAKISSLNIKQWTMHADPLWLRLNWCDHNRNCLLRLGLNWHCKRRWCNRQRSSRLHRHQL